MVTYLDHYCSVFIILRYYLIFQVIWIEAYTGVIHERTTNFSNFIQMCSIEIDVRPRVCKGCMHVLKLVGLFY